MLSEESGLQRNITYSCDIQQNISLADKNWFKSGGPAKYFAQPNNEIEFLSTVQFAKDNSQEIFILGAGANLLISDEGVNGLVIRPQINFLNITSGKDYSFLEAGAGVQIPDLIEFCLNNNLLGLEEFSGIPGTVGGSVFINIHYFQYLLSQFIVSAKVLNKNSMTIEEVDNSWFKFGYDYSKLHDGNHYLVSCTLKLKNATAQETNYAKGRSVEIIRHRLHRYPTSNTCGSFFRNFHDDEVTLSIDNKKMTRVAYYLDLLGIKGMLSVGGAYVSYHHANMIVNNGGKSSDVITLARTMQTLAKDKFGILPQPECQFVGFNTYPLMQL